MGFRVVVRTALPHVRVLGLLYWSARLRAALQPEPGREAGGSVGERQWVVRSG